jgi:hypothetical protein
VGNVTEEQILEYLRTFHSTLIDRAGRYLPLEKQTELLHTARLPARVIAYVSTQFGVAIHYETPEDGAHLEETTFHAVRGSRRVEDLVLAGAPRAPLEHSPPTVVIEGRYWFLGIHLKAPFRIARENAEVVFDRCTFSLGDPKAPSWAMGTGLLEVYGNRRADNWTPDKAVSRAQEEVLAALFQLQRAQQNGVPLAEYITRFREKTVLILGSYSLEGLARLRAIQAFLRGMGYEGVLLIDVPDQEAQSLDQKVVMLGSLSRFLVIDDTEKSGHLKELSLCQENDWITIILRPGGRPSSAMTAGAAIFSTVILEASYEGSSIVLALPDAIVWAEERRNQVGSRLRPGPWAAPPQ